MKNLKSKFDFEREIKRLDNYTVDKEAPFDIVIKTSKKHLCDLRKEIFLKGFDSIKSEIYFFKETKQRPLLTLIYGSQLKNFEARFPKGNQARQQKYILGCMKKLNNFFQNNSEFSQYIKLRLVHLDEFYFTRKHFSEFSYLFSVPFFRDPNFSTSHDLLLARHSANYKLLKYIERRLHKLRNPSLKKLSSSKLKWTSSKAALTELTYALYHGRAINNGNTNIVEIAQALQNTFNFPLGDVYRTYIEIRSRKNRRTKFLDELSTSLMSSMDRLEE